MKTGKITAKLRDAVPVCLMVNGEEVKRYKNIELPDELKAVENGPEGIEAAYNVTGVRRKQLVVAVGDFIGAKPEYLRAPTYAFAVGSYNIDKEGTLTGADRKPERTRLHCRRVKREGPASAGLFLSSVKKDIF